MNRMAKVIFLAVVVSVAVGSTASAYIPDGSGNIFGCYLKKKDPPLPKRNLRLIDVDNGDTCNSKEQQVAWSGGLVSSDRTLKSGFATIDDRALLSKLDSLDIMSWTYKSDAPNVRHVGPVAQDFKALFGFGSSDKTIAPVDENGVALASIKALSGLVRAQQRQLDMLKIALVAVAGGFVVWMLRARRRRPV